jgi:hypothetical protein
MDLHSAVPVAAAHGNTAVFALGWVGVSWLMEWARGMAEERLF